MPEQAGRRLGVPRAENRIIKPLEGSPQVDLRNAERFRRGNSATAAQPATAPSQPRGFLGKPDADTLERLRSGQLQTATKGRSGRTLAFKVALDSGVQGYYKPEQRLASANWYAEPAAFYLDRALKLDRVSPVVTRKLTWKPLQAAAEKDPRSRSVIVDREGLVRGALVAWLSDKLTPVELPRGWEDWLRVEPRTQADVSPYQSAAAYKQALAAAARKGRGAAAPTSNATKASASAASATTTDATKATANAPNVPNAPTPNAPAPNAPTPITTKPSASGASASKADTTSASATKANAPASKADTTSAGATKANAPTASTPTASTPAANTTKTATSKGDTHKTDGPQAPTPAPATTNLPPLPRPELAAELSDLIVFDYLTANYDRFESRDNLVTLGDDGPLIFLDNGAAFSPATAQNAVLLETRLAFVSKFRRSTIEAVRTLDIEALRATMAADPLGPLLDAAAWRALEARRAAVLEHVARVEKRFGDAVYAW